MKIIKISSLFFIIGISVYLFISGSESAVEFSSYNQLQDTDIKALYIYDTSTDVDSAWPKDTTRSWYEESGPFPKVAYLILSNSGLDIVDANTKSTWMQFYNGSNHLLPAGDYTSVTALNGKILLGTNSGLIILDFTTDSARLFTNDSNWFSVNNLAGRNSTTIWCKEKGNTITHNLINDVAITKIGEIEYAAAGTGKGVSIINLANNSVYRSSGSLGAINAVAFGDNDLYYGSNDGLYAKYDIDLLNDNWAASEPKIITNTVNDIAVLPGKSTVSPGNNTIFVATNNGITEIQEHQFLPSLSQTTHWTDEILSANNISCITTDGSSLWAGDSFGVDEIKLFNKSRLYKTYTVDSSPSIINNNITALSSNGLVLVGTPNGCIALDEKWWDTPGYRYRQQLLIENNAGSDLPEGYTVNLAFNHSELVNSGKSLTSGDDVRIVFYDGSTWTELDRVLEQGRIWFKTKAITPQGVSDSRYYLYYGNPKAVDPPADKNKVFLFWEDFEDDTIDQPPTGWANDSGDEFIVSKSISNRLRKFRYISDENDITADAITEIDNFELTFLGRKLANNNNPLNKLGILFHSGNNGYRVSMGSHGAAMLQDEEFKPVLSCVANFNFLDDTDHKVKIQVYDTGLKVLFEGNEVLKTTISSGSGRIGFFNDNDHATGGPEIDDICLRRYIEPEPSVVSNYIEMANIPTGDIVKAGQIKSDYVDITFTIDSPYDEPLKAKLEWSINPTTGFQKCYLEGEHVDNSNPYQIGNIDTIKGPSTVTVKWKPANSTGFPSDAVGTYWVRLTASNDSVEQEVPDIISLTVDTRGVSTTQSAVQTTADAESALASAIASSIASGIVIITDNTTEIIADYLSSKKPSKLAFITPPQTIVVNTVSDIITLQIQDMNGNPVNASGDIVIELSTTSGRNI